MGKLNLVNQRAQAHVPGIAWVYATNRRQPRRSPELSVARETVTYRLPLPPVSARQEAAR